MEERGIQEGSICPVADSPAGSSSWTSEPITPVHIKSFPKRKEYIILLWRVDWEDVNSRQITAFSLLEILIFSCQLSVLSVSL